MAWIFMIFFPSTWTTRMISSRHKTPPTRTTPTLLYVFLQVIFVALYFPQCSLHGFKGRHSKILEFMASSIFEFEIQIFKKSSFKTQLFSVLLLFTKSKWPDRYNNFETYFAYFITIFSFFMNDWIYKYNICTVSDIK